MKTRSKLNNPNVTCLCLTFTLSSYYSNVYPRYLFFFIFISIKKGVTVKRGVVAVLTALLAVLFLYPSPAHATFTHDFLSKFQSRWTDIAVNSAGTRVFIINESYSRIEEYDSSGVLQAIHGSFGTGNTPNTEFKRPQGMAIDSSDMLYVLDTGNNRVVRYDVSSAFTYSTQWGSYGTVDKGTFNNPMGIATDGTYVYIADTDNNRVQRCDVAGPASTCVIWGSLGMADGTFSAPKGITTASSLIYVADTGNNRIQIFNTSGVFQEKFGSYGVSETSTGSFVLPFRLAIDNIGPYIYILDNLNRIQRFVLSTKLYSGSKIALNSRGGGIWVNNSTATLYVASFPTTLEKDGPNNNKTNSYSKKDNDIGRPVDMAVDNSDNIYINNNLNENGIAPSPAPVVQKFNSSFVQQNEWTGVSGFASSSTTGPMGIGSNTGNEIYVADTDANKLQKYNSLGSWVDVPTPAAPIGAYNSPKDVASEATGKYYVADTGNSRIVKYDPGLPGGFMTWQLVTPTPGGPTINPVLTPEPYGITIASDNTVYVADYGYSRIQSFNANGTFMKSWGQFGSADNLAGVPQFDRPQGMAIDSSNYIFVADTYNSRIQRFNQTGGDSTIWGEYGAGDTQFDIPRNVAVNTKNQVLVSEVGNKRIQVFGDASVNGVVGLTIVENGGTNIAEGIDAAHTVVDTYTVQLKTQPVVPKGQPINTPVYVYVDLAVNYPLQATVTTPRLTFDQYNWNIPQTVTVVPTHDFIANGSHDVVITHTVSSTNAFYANISPQTVTAHITDTIDIPSIVFSSSTVPTITEGTKLSTAYSIKLKTKPTAIVTVTLTPDATMTLDKTVYTFTTTDFGTEQNVNITPIHDFVAYPGGTYSGIIHHTATSADPIYTSPAVIFRDAADVVNATGNVTATITDIDSIGLTLTPATALSVNESGAGTTATYTVVLKSKPTGEVQVALADASGQVTLSPATLIFLTTTWNTPQTVTITAVHDFLKNSPSVHDATVAYTLTSSLDTAYNGLSVSSTTVHVTDADTTGLLIFRPGGGSVQVTEGGATDTYAFQLTSIPSTDVDVVITSLDNQATTSASLYSFTPANWNMAQYATVSAIDNTISDGAHWGVFLHTLSSTDTNFNRKTAYETAVIIDNDVPGITVTLPNGVINIAEAGPSDNYFIRLGTQPTSPVTLVFDAQSQATASPTNLVFDSTNWNINQEVVISAIQNFIVQGPHTATVKYTGVSLDAQYSGRTASFVANITDDDSLTPGISVVETDGGTSVTKDVTTDTYSLVLTSKPSSNVKIRIISSGPEATTSAGLYWFTPSAWSTPQTVTVLAKTNPVGGKTNTFSHLTWSLDQHYNNIKAPTVTVTVNENRATSPSAANAKPPVCSNTPPYSAPNLFQVSTTQTEATLSFTPIRDNISYYFVAYGFTPGDMRFGTSFEMGPYDGVINYTVSMLTPGTTYYFMVRGGNGCATGPWSQSVAATAVGPESSSATTRVYYAPVTAPTTSSGSSSSSSGGGISLGRDLYPGSQGADVRSLQQYLNSKGFTLASSGVGSPGNETTYYGNLTAAAVRRFQEAHFAEILSPLGYASGTGIVGPSTRGYINSHP